jgi:hypothetical protein
VIRDVLPVATLRMLVRKKIAIRMARCGVDTSARISINTNSLSGRDATVQYDERLTSPEKLRLTVTKAGYGA